MPEVVLPFSIVDFACGCVVVDAVAVFGVVKEGTLVPVSIGVGVDTGEGRSRTDELSFETIAVVQLESSCGWNYHIVAEFKL